MKQARISAPVVHDAGVAQNVYYDHSHRTMAIKLLPGEYYVSASGELIVTVLGSCVSACVRDTVLGIGGMNHFLLPDRERHPIGDPVSQGARYGTYAMECLINEILKQGGRRANLEIKVFGGGQILSNMTDIGRRNIDFILKYINTENLWLTAKDLGGTAPRKIYFFPQSGRVRVKRLGVLKNETLMRRERSYLHELDERPPQGEVELF